MLVEYGKQMYDGKRNESDVFCRIEHREAREDAQEMGGLAELRQTRASPSKIMRQEDALQEEL